MGGTALVTGASSGFGELYARKLARKGNDLVIVARRVELLEKLAAELRESCGVEVEVICADLCSDEGIARVERRAAAGDITMLVNNAGYSVDGPFAETDIDSQVAVVTIHDVTTIRLARAVLPGMLTRRSGAIINVASLAGLLPADFQVVYNASKAFLISFTESLTHEVAGKGIRLQALCPSYTHTEFQGVMGHMPSAPGLMWQGPEEVVDESLRKIESSRTVVVVPGLLNKVFAVTSNLLPRRLRLLVLRIVT